MTEYRPLIIRNGRAQELGVGDTFVGQRYDLSFFCVGKPGAGERLLDHVAVVAFTLPAGLTGSQAVATTGPSAAVTFNLNKNGTQVGTINFAAGATVGTFAASNAISIGIGDRLTLTAPATQDANLSDLTFTLANTPAASAAAAASPAIVPAGQCRLTYSSSTALLLKPFQGNQLWVNGAFRAVPSAGVSLANTGLAASTLYYVYALMSGSTLTLEASTTGHAADANYGHEIKSGDGTRTLVGMVYTTSGSPGTFIDSPTTRWVASYFNRQQRAVYGGSANPTTTSTSLTELSTAVRTDFLTWADESIEISASAGVQHTTAGQYGQISVAIDGSGVGQVGTATSSGANQINNAVATWNTSLVEGRHYGSALGLSQNGNTCTFNNLQVMGMVRS